MALNRIPEQRSRYGVKGFNSRVRAFAGAAIALVSGVGTLVPLNTEQYDSLNEFNPAAANYSFTPQHAGWYLIISHVTVAASLAAQRFSTWLFLNGIIPIVTDDTILSTFWLTTSKCVTVEHLVPTDVLQVYVMQVSGANLNIGTGREDTFICVHRLS